MPQLATEQTRIGSKGTCRKRRKGRSEEQIITMRKKLLQIKVIFTIKSMFTYIDSNGSDSEASNGENRGRGN
jgi:hypothetical protein